MSSASSTGISNTSAGASNKGAPGSPASQSATSNSLNSNGVVRGASTSTAGAPTATGASAPGRRGRGGGRWLGLFGIVSDLARVYLRGDIMAYRIHGPGGAQGQWYSEIPPSTFVYEGLVRDGWAILPEWGSPLSHESRVFISRENIRYIQVADPQISSTGRTYPGGQIEIRVWNPSEVTVVETYPVTLIPGWPSDHVGPPPAGE